MLLGEARSKCEHLAKVPMRSDTANELHRLFLVKGVMATTAIEGNTLTEEEVAARVDGHLQLPPSRDYLGIEVDNITQAVQGVIQELFETRRCQPLSADLLKDFNREILKNLEVADWVVPGEFRDVTVGVGNVYLGPSAEDIDYLVDRMCSWLNDPSFDGPTGRRFERGILRALLAHLYIAWIHPFGDGNGRVARMVEWQQIVRAGIPVPAAFALTSHYNVTRTEYYRALDRASKTEDGAIGFLFYALRGFVDGLRDQIRIVHKQQRDLAWRDWLSQYFANRGVHSPAMNRRHQLVIRLSAEPMTRSTILSMAMYGERTGKTLTRDLNYLTKNRLVIKRKGRYSANKSILYQYLPICAEPQDQMVDDSDENP
jgi:Fic family protein